MQSGPSLPEPLDKGFDYSPYATYRMLYHLDRLMHGWRQLLVFYLAMFIAGFAQEINSWVFWSSWASLLLVYWEPYLSPPYTWTEGTDQLPGDSFTEIELDAWHSRPRIVIFIMSIILRLPAAINRWLPATEEEKQGMRQWLHAVRQGLWETQQLVHRCLCGLIAVPCICLFIGATMATKPSDSKAMYSGYLLLALVCVYTVLSSSSLIIFLVVVRPTLGKGSHLAPKDMMFFTCKILGQILNTTVQTLVAGSFTAYMPSVLFWLCIGITAMSYTATNLIYDLDPEQSVKQESTKGCLPENSGPQNGDCYNGSKDCGGGGGDGILSKGQSTTQHNTATRVLKHSTQFGKHDYKASLQRDQVDNTNLLAGQGSKDVTLTVPTPAVADSTRHNNKQLGDKNNASPTPAFLLYKPPHGVRGWSIIVLLMAASLPSAVVLCFLILGRCTGNRSYYFVDNDPKCVDICFMRYKEMLYMLCISAFLTCYYAITLILGAGPVTCLYKQWHRMRHV